MSDEEYMKLLDRAFEKMPKLAADVSDFKIPVVDAMVQGSKTIIRNLSVIADKARGDPQNIARYMSKELAVPVNIEEQRLVISGKFTNDDLNKRIRKYFEVYVICKECRKPDSHLEAAGRGMFYFVCEACGARYGIKSY
ncbi:MAG: translation initiation factor IF-2 subunit beta [Candidatus Marsarchaeota archaeon]|nr:translation initiation factor IF-2 subunit beta [Candidatus Marsarchaeota archaeon]